MNPFEFRNLINPMKNSDISYTKGNRFLDPNYFQRAPKFDFTKFDFDNYFKIFCG